MTSISDIDENGINRNLKVRYQRDEIYVSFSNNNKTHLKIRNYRRTETITIGGRPSPILVHNCEQESAVNGVESKNHFTYDLLAQCPRARFYFNLIRTWASLHVLH